MAVYAAGVRVAGPNTLRGNCTCGWNGPEHRDGRKADADVQEHLASGEHWTNPK